MRKIILLLMQGIMVITGLRAQNFHINFFGGISNYQGDLQDKRYTFQQSHPAFGIGLAYEISDHFSGRAIVMFGKVSGDDKKASKNITRNLNFSSPLTDLHLGIEYDLFSLYERSVTPYIFAGISAFRFNPSTIDAAGKKVYLQPLGTEGQGFFDDRKKYKLNQLAVPFGGGLKFSVNDNVRIGFEIGLRKLLTDYLDDVSTSYVDETLLLNNNGQEAVSVAFRGDEIKPVQPYPHGQAIRGNPKSKDWYYFSVLSLSFRIVTSENRWHSSKSRTGCPRPVY